MSLFLKRDLAAPYTTRGGLSIALLLAGLLGAASQAAVVELPAVEAVTYDGPKVTPHEFTGDLRHLPPALSFLGRASTTQAAIPASERAVLTNLYVSTNGVSWPSKTNWNGPVETECSWYDVSCDGAQSHVVGIHLYRNDLIGQSNLCGNSLGSSVNPAIDAAWVTARDPNAVASVMVPAGFQTTVPYVQLRASPAVAQPGSRCPPGADASDEAIALILGMDTARLDRLRKLRYLSNSDICDMPTTRLQRAIAKLDSPKPDHPGEWASFRALRQADENGIVKPDGLIQGIQRRQAILEASLAARMAAGSDAPPLAGISPSGWTTIGPGNIGGRIRSILIHPIQTNKMWVGSVSGGIWVSTDSGASWNPVNDFMGNLSVSSLVMDPTNSNVLYAGTGEGFFNVDAVRGAGIFKSTDGGVTWSQMASTNPAGGSQWYYVNRLAIHPGNGNIMLVATGSGTYRTTDGGTSWSLVASGRALDVRINPADGNNAIIGRDNGQALYSTTAASATPTWTLVAFVYGGQRVELAYAPSAANTAYAVVDAPGTTTYADLYKTTNGGATWSYVSSPNHLGEQGWYNNAVWVDPTNSLHLIVGGIDLWRSTNGGVSFTKISRWSSAPQSPHADHHAIISSPAYNGSTNRTIFFGNDGGVYKAQDIAAVTSVTTGWSVLNNGLGITQFYGGAGKSAAGGRIIGGTQDNGDLKYSGAGTNWSAWEGGDGGYSAVDGSNDNSLYGEYIYLAIHRSTNGGASTAIICNGITEGYGDATFGCGATATTEANFIAPFILDPNNNNRMLAGAKSLWVSNNVKAATPNWTTLKPPSGTSSSFYISAISVAEGNSDIIWVGHNNGRVYKTTNGTATNPTWTQVSGLPARMVLRILVDKSDTNRVYVSFGGFSAGNLQLTTNGGTSWTNISGTLPSVPIGSIVRHPTNPSWLYAGTEVGLFTSENGGNSWTTTNDGPANVAVDELFWYDTTKLVAATHGRGMFMTTLGSSGTIYTLTVAKSGTGSGTVTSTPAGINCGATCSASYTGGASVSLTATPAAGSSFAGWSGACLGTGTCTVTMNSAMSVAATFALADDGFPAGGAIPAGWIQPFGSNASWVVTNDAAYAGSLSLKSGIIGDNQKSEISYTASFSAGNVSFARKVSSESTFDFLEFYIDGVLQNRWSGELDWAVVSFPISAGTHTLLWRYVKDAFVSSGGDAAWIDAVSLPAGSSAVFRFGSPTYDVTESAGSVLLIVSRAGDTAGTVSVQYGTCGVGCSALATAASGSDFVASSGTLNFGPGVGTKTISISVSNDGIVEGNESFSVVLSNPSGGTLGAPGTANITILDSQSAQLSLVGRLYNVPSPDNPDLAYLRIYNIGTFSGPVAGTLYDQNGTMLGTADLALSASLPAKGVLVLSSADVAARFGVTAWSGRAWMELKSSLPAGTLLFQNLIRSASLTNMSCVSDSVALNIPAVSNTDQAFLRLYNVGATSGAVRGTLYDQSGNVLGNPNSTLVTSLGAKAVSVLSAANIQNATGAPTWTGRAWLTLAADFGSNLKIMNLIRDASNTLNNMSCVFN